MGTGLFSPLHIVILLLVALLLFGAKRLPEIGRSLGTGMREFKDSVQGINEPSKVEAQATQLPPPVPASAEPVAPTQAADPGRETEPVS
jgi:sec-independent protein translocase protein TatA